MTVQTETTNVGELLDELRAISDEMDELDSQKKRLTTRWDHIERTLLDFHKTAGTNSLSTPRLSVTFDPGAMRAKYDPEHWNDIQKWAAETNNAQIIQRRLSDAKVLELIDAGIALPEGLTVEGYTKISIRRK